MAYYIYYCNDTLCVIHTHLIQLKSNDFHDISTNKQEPQLNFYYSNVYCVWTVY